jgi:hypothetical protein
MISARRTLPGSAPVTFVSERYCFEGPIRFLALSVSIRLVNAHSFSLYVLKPEARVRPNIIHVYVAKDESEFEAWQERIVNQVVRSRRFRVRRSKLPSGSVRKSTPRSFYEYRDSFTVPLARTGEESRGQGIAPGAHLAAVVLAPWLQTSDRACQAEKDLRLDGMIWTEVTRTDAISFTVAPTHLEEDCYKEFRESRSLK